MAEKERAGRLAVPSIRVGGVALPKVAAGTLSVTGTGTVTAPSGFKSIAGVIVALAADASTAGLFVTYVTTGLSVTIKVWKPTATGDCTPIAATAAKNVSYVIFGS